jgi:voltage-gated potassium channel
MSQDIDIGKLQDHFIICGYGQMGRAVVGQLSRSGMPFVVVETNDELHRELLKNGVLGIHVDARQRGVLLSAGIERARGICIVIDNDPDNLSVTILARSLNAKLKIIARAGQRCWADSLHKSGADEVVIPEYLGGLAVRRIVHGYYPVHAILL